MGFYSTFRSYSWVLNGCFILIGAYLLADTANFFVASRLLSTTASSKEIPTESIPSTRSTLLEIATDYRSIVIKNIFDQGVRKLVPVQYIPPPPPIILPLPLPPPVIVAPPKAPLNMTLIGTVVSAEGPSRSYAVIEDNRVRRQYIYRIGDFLLPDAKLIQIHRTRVIISRGDEEEVLVTALSGLKGGATPTVPDGALPHESRERSPDGEGIRQVSRGRWVMDRAEVDDAIVHLPELLTKARVVPNFTDGKPDGFRIFAIREDSLYSRIGLQNGDILRRVNNIDVGNPQNFLEVFERLKGEANIKIELIRDNKEETFDYTIR
jgi:general secretion pathway protein C